ncbi:MAG: transporter substrate-binding domain-containing protein [Halofilum sp. (in: g-proteobacteria)]|nr:transporter substrate-binding domain-containing protein [Halofilum sp. (in: g-proteobacteria)]
MRNMTRHATILGATLTALAIALALAPQRAAVAQDSYTICSDIPWPPFEMGSGGQEAFGFDMDVMRAIAAIQGYDVEIQNLAFDSIIPAVRAGKCDIGASGFTITAKRDEAVDFTDPYYVSNQAVVTRSDGEVNVVTAMAGQGPNGAVGAQRGTTGAAWVKENLVENGVDVTLELYETYPLAIIDLVNGRIDAVIQDAPASKSSVAAHPDALTVAGVVNTYEYFGFVVPAGDPDGVGAKISAGLGELGLNVADTAAGTELSVQPGTPWADLSSAYFGPDSETITAAWEACKDGILGADSMGDVKSYAECMARETK